MITPENKDNVFESNLSSLSNTDLFSYRQKEFLNFYISFWVAISNQLIFNQTVRGNLVFFIVSQQQACFEN